MKVRSFPSLFLAAAFLVGVSTVGSVHTSANASTRKPAAVATATPTPAPTATPTTAPAALPTLPPRPGTSGLCGLPGIAAACKLVTTIFGGVPN